MSDDPGTADAELALQIAAEAGRRLLALRGSYETNGEGPGAAAERTARLRDAADRLSHEYITAELARRRPHDAVLSEEGPARPGQPARLAAGRVWIVDPLDGTREFGEPGRGDWAVHVALWERDPLNRLPGAGEGPAGPAAGAGDLTAGAVALPAQGVTLSTAGPVPAARPRLSADGAVTGAAQKPFRIVVSRTRRPAIAEKLAEVLGGSAGAELVPLGSAGAKVAAVLAGDADAYVHEGGFYEWDTAAPAAVARSAGFHASRLDGGPLRYNQDNVWMPDILVCPSALAGTLLDAIAAVRPGPAPAIG